MYALTQLEEITAKAITKTTTLAKNGAFFVPDTETSHSLAMPLPIATRLLIMLIVPNTSDKFPPPCNPLAEKSATIQLSKTLNKRLVLRPPNTLPRTSATPLLPKNTIDPRDGKQVSRQERAYERQKNRQARFRPYLSAREPMKAPETAPERNPVVKRADMRPWGR